MTKKEIYALAADSLQKICDESVSYADVARKLCCSNYDGRIVNIIKNVLQEKKVIFTTYLGQHHIKNKGKVYISIEDYLSNKRKITSFKLRNKLIETGILEYKCSSCGLSVWLDKKIPLELHHKDGNKFNNNIENLVLLCPNCHYFTDTYKSKNRQN